MLLSDSPTPPPSRGTHVQTKNCFERNGVGFLGGVYAAALVAVAIAGVTSPELFIIKSVEMTTDTAGLSSAESTYVFEMTNYKVRGLVSRDAPRDGRALDVVILSEHCRRETNAAWALQRFLVLGPARYLEPTTLLPRHLSFFFHRLLQNYFDFVALTSCTAVHCTATLLPLPSPTGWSMVRANAAGTPEHLLIHEAQRPLAAAAGHES